MEQNVEVVMLSPSQILADDNLRFGLKTSKINNLVDKIKAAGGVNDPVEVTPLAESINGYDYKLNVGHYRVAACLKIAESGTEIMVPAIIRDRVTAEARRERQISENLDRENMSPMDCAMAFKTLLDEGWSKMDVRKIFMRPGGAKGNKQQPISNALLNMYIRFLEFPKDIQKKIHNGPEEGGIAVATAYELYKSDPLKWEAILKRAEDNRLAELSRDEKDEEKFLAQERRNEEAAQKQAEEKQKLEDAKAAASKAESDLKAQSAKVIDAFADAKNEMDEDKRKEKEEILRKLEEEGRAAERANAQAKKELDKQESKVKSAAAQAEERRKKLELIRQDEEKKRKAAATPRPGDIRKASKELGDTNHKPISLVDIRETVAGLCLPSTTPKVLMIGQAFKEHLAGISTPSQLYSDLQKVVGEYKEPKVKK
jgi:ParB/RepB/Spo0J family partition protein